MWNTLLTVSVYSVELYLWVKTVIQTGEDPSKIKHVSMVGRNVYV